MLCWLIPCPNLAAFSSPAYSILLNKPGLILLTKTYSKSSSADQYHIADAVFRLPILSSIPQDLYTMVEAFIALHKQSNVAFVKTISIYPRVTGVFPPYIQVEERRPVV